MNVICAHALVASKAAAMSPKKRFVCFMVLVLFSWLIGYCLYFILLVVVLILYIACIMYANVMFILQNTMKMVKKCNVEVENVD